MRKIRAIALREYLAAVKAKAFLVTILLMPVLMGGSVGLQILFKKLDDAKEKRYAVIDRTPNQKIFAFLEDAAQKMRAAKAKDPQVASLLGAKASFVAVPPSSSTAEAMAEQRYEISQQIEKGEYEALIEIGPRVFDFHPEVVDIDKKGFFVNPEKVDDQAAVRFQAKNVGAMQFRRLVEGLVSQAVQQERLQKKGLSLLDIQMAQIPVAVKAKALTRRDSKTGELVDAADETQIINIFLPFAFIMLMFMIIMMCAAPAMHGVIEEKSQRIAEVLLGSVAPFQLMAGKLLGVVAVSVTMAVVYLSGGFFVASHFGFADMLPLSLLGCFLGMLILALLIFGSLFIAIGAAAADIKETQTLLMPVMMIACLPFFALGPIMQDPSGPIARACSFFPLATPMLLVARQSVPPGVPWWEMLAGIALVLATTLVCVWAAGRIFRVGILMQGKGPKFADLIRWAIKG
jgi:ABC-2 type transport system permease protein